MFIKSIWNEAILNKKLFYFNSIINNKCIFAEKHGVSRLGLLQMEGYPGKRESFKPWVWIS